MNMFIKRIVLAILLTVVMPLAVTAQKNSAPEASSGIDKYSIALPDSELDAGTLTLSRIPPSSATVQLHTKRGESVKQVIKRLCVAAKEKSVIRGGSPEGRIISGILGGWDGCGLHVFGGRNHGLPLPPTPKSLSVSYDFEKDHILISWDLQGYAYSSITAPTNGEGSYRMDEDATRMPLTDVSKHPMLYPVNDLTVAVVGYRGEIPSNAGLMRLRGDRQEELYALPFSNGVHPNWTTWIASAEKARVSFEQGSHDNGKKTKRFQVLKATTSLPGARYDFGMRRKFLNLEPGQRYRFGIRTRFMAKREASTEWSLWVLPLSAEADDVTMGDLTASDPPDGSVRLFGQKSEAANGNGWKKWRTGTKETSDILVPNKCSSLLFWIRLRGKGGGKSVLNFDGVFLERIDPKKEQKKDED